MLQQMLQNELILFGSQTWLSLGDPHQCPFCIQDSGVCVTSNPKTRARSFIKAVPPEACVCSICLVPAHVPVMKITLPCLR